MFDEPGNSVKTEAREVLVLKFGENAHRDVVTADGATIPNEVAVYLQDRIVGRAVLHLREDGIYADILLSLGSMEGQGGTAITIVKRSEQKLNGQRVIQEYEITGVGLVKANVETQPDVQPEIKNDSTKSEPESPVSQDNK